MDANQLDLFLMAPENEPEKSTPPLWRRLTLGPNQEQGAMPVASDGADLPVVEEIIDPRKCRRRQRIGV